MPFEPHVRVTALGYLGNPAAERFSYGFNVMNRVTAPLADWFNIGPGWSDVSDDVATFHAHASCKISQYAVLDAVKVAAIGADGKYTDDPKIYVKNVPGGVPHDDSVVPQMALAVSLMTDLRGPSGKGRFYLPMPVTVAGYNDGFRIGASVADAVRAQVVTLCNNVANEPGFDLHDLRVCVASTKGFNTPVTGVRVGRVIDTIRSRRGSLPESYSTVAGLQA